MRTTQALVEVAVALMQDAPGKHWGYNLGKESGVRSGVLYPVLHRMLEEGWLEDGWEEPDPGSKRPPRRYYELTDLGLKELGAVLETARREARFEGVRGRLAW